MSDNKTYKTIGEVSDILNIPEYVLRFWETKFPQISPEKINGRRYYTESHIDNIRKIKSYLYDKGMTIKGALNALSNNNIELDSSKTSFSNDNIVSSLEEIKNNLELALGKIIKADL
ncbi:MAG: MerR family transcriptional regulator [Alphaproteobacteria bacterium]|nr:MerR family transcriptional regulator [Alphaproteobacteria bacterium]OJV12029.1 MAG: hypothetical protein BGO27_00385 [Alphaproteobacteria bacterium 33-17]